MNDPHVVALIYGIEHRASVDYEEAESFVLEEPVFGRIYPRRLYVFWLGCHRMETTSEQNVYLWIFHCREVHHLGPLSCKNANATSRLISRI